MEKPSEKCVACDGIGYHPVKPPKGCSLKQIRVGCFICSGSGKKQRPLREILKEAGEKYRKRELTHDRNN